MSRKKTEINPVRAERVKTLIKKEKISQTTFSELIHMTQQNISKIINGKVALTEETAQDIVKVFPEYRIEWLMGYDDFMTTEDLKKHYVSFTDQTNDASLTMLDHSLRTICMIKGIKAPVIDNIPEILFLQAQLKDYSDHLMRDYLDRINGNNTSHVWDFLDQLPDNSNSDHNSENIKSEQKTGEKS